jgi:hypothetical protein
MKTATGPEPAIQAPRRSLSLGFSDQRVPDGQHICYIYHDDTERRRVMSKYLESGLLAGEKVLYLADEMTPAEMLESLQTLGVDTMSPGLDVVPAASTYCLSSGSFQPDEMLAVVREYHRQALAEGYTGLRGSGEMGWCLEDDRVDETRLLEYEAKLSLLVAECPCTACCQYDARRLSGRTILDLMSVHPVMIVRGQLVENPFYVEPAVLLREYQARKQQDV